MYHLLQLLFRKKPSFVRRFFSWCGVWSTGLLAGGIIGLLWAPRKGTATRKKLRRLAKKTSDQVVEQAQTTKDQIEEKVEASKNMIDDKLENLKK